MKKIRAAICVNTNKFFGKSETHFWGMCMVQNVVVGMRNIAVRNVVAVVEESVRKVAACATHSGEERRRDGWHASMQPRPM